MYNAELRGGLPVDDAKILENALRQNAPLSDELGWQLIETAPKDGSHILCRTDGYKKIRISWFYNGQWHWDGDYVGMPMRKPPTHWMPLDTGLAAEFLRWESPETHMPPEGKLLLMQIPEWGEWPYLGYVNYEDAKPWVDRDGDECPTPSLWMLSPLPPNAELTRRSTAIENELATDGRVE